MDRSELEELTTGLYSRFKTAKVDLEILTEVPDVILTYDETEHVEPPEVTEYFQQNPEELGLLHTDDYLYQNNVGQSCRALRMKNIADDIHQIINSQPMQKYLCNLVNVEKTKLTPDNWDCLQVEKGLSHGKDEPYMNACYFIPNEGTYRMSVSASKAKDDSSIEVRIFITQPEVMHFDGTDHSSYKIHLELVKGTVSDLKLLENPTQEMISYAE